MARLSRIIVPGYPHHVAQCGVGSMDVFHTDTVHGEYLGMLGEETAQHGVTILTWCLMTAHIHLVVVPYRQTSPAGATQPRDNREGLENGPYEKIVLCPPISASQIAKTS
jgi:REP element-mobilizing transposase RayT